MVYCKLASANASFEFTQRQKIGRTPFELLAGFCDRPRFYDRPTADRDSYKRLSKLSKSTNAQKATTGINIMLREFLAATILTSVRTCSIIADAALNARVGIAGRKEARSYSTVYL